MVVHMEFGNVLGLTVNQLFSLFRHTKLPFWEVRHSGRTKFLEIHMQDHSPNVDKRKILMNALGFT
jgi:hypothetical protein